MHLPAVERNVFLGVVGCRGAGGEALRDGLLHVRRVILRQRTLFPDAGVAWERTLRSIDYVYKIELNRDIAIRNREHLDELSKDLAEVSSTPAFYET